MKQSEASLPGLQSDGCWSGRHVMGRGGHVRASATASGDENAELTELALHMTHEQVHGPTGRCGTPELCEVRLMPGSRPSFNIKVCRF